MGWGSKKKQVTGLTLPQTVADSASDGTAVDGSALPLATQQTSIAPVAATAPVDTIPDPNDRVLQIRKRYAQALSGGKRSGRDSTILQRDGGTLG